MHPKNPFRGAPEEFFEKFFLQLILKFYDDFKNRLFERFWPTWPNLKISNFIKLLRGQIWPCWQKTQCLESPKDDF